MTCCSIEMYNFTHQELHQLKSTPMLTDVLLIFFFCHCAFLLSLLLCEVVVTIILSDSLGRRL